MPQQEAQQEPKEKLHTGRNVGLLAGGAVLGGLGIRALTKGKFKGKMKAPAEATVMSRKDVPLLPEYKGASYGVPFERMPAAIQRAYLMGAKMAEETDTANPQFQYRAPESHAGRTVGLMLGAPIAGAIGGGLIGHGLGSRYARKFLQDVPHMDPAAAGTLGGIHQKFNRDMAEINARGAIEEATEAGVYGGGTLLGAGGLGTEMYMRNKDHQREQENLMAALTAPQMNDQLKQAYAHGVKVALDEVEPEQAAADLPEVQDDPHRLRRMLLASGGALGGATLGAALGHMGGASMARRAMAGHAPDSILRKFHEYQAQLMHDNMMMGGSGIGAGVGAGSGYGLSHHLDNAAPLGTDEEELAAIEGKQAAYKQAYGYGAATALQEAGVPYTRAVKVAFDSADEAVDAAEMYHPHKYNTDEQQAKDILQVLGGSTGGALLGGLIGHGTGTLARNSAVRRGMPSLGTHANHVLGGVGLGALTGGIAPLPFQFAKENDSAQAYTDQARSQWEDLNMRKLKDQWAAEQAATGPEKLSYDEEAMAELEASPEGRSILSRLLTGGAGAIGGATLGAALGHGAGKYVTGPGMGAAAYRGLDPGLQVPSMFRHLTQGASAQHAALGAPIGAAAGLLGGGALGAAYDGDGYDPKVGSY
jgi:hypothetical protein